MTKEYQKFMNIFKYYIHFVIGVFRGMKAFLATINTQDHSKVEIHNEQDS